MTRPATRDIELSVELDASPEDVFRAVTDGTELAKWLAPEARVTADWLLHGEVLLVRRGKKAWHVARFG